MSVKLTDRTEIVALTPRDWRVKSWIRMALTSGARRMNQGKCASMCSLEFQRVDVLDVGRLPGAVEGDDDREADRHLSRGDGDDEENEDLRVVVGQAIDKVEAREGDEGEVGRIQHQLEAHEDDDDIPAQHDPPEADGEEQAAHEKVMIQGERHFNSRLERTITPIVATRMRAPMT